MKYVPIYTPRFDADLFLIRNGRAYFKPPTPSPNLQLLISTFSESISMSYSLANIAHVNKMTFLAKKRPGQIEPPPAKIMLVQ